MSKETKFTKGPWKRGVSMNGNLTVRSDGYIICTLNPPNKYSDQLERYREELETYEADQKLIHAAPDLYEACEQLLDFIEDVQPSCAAGYDQLEYVRGLAQAALNKAI